MFLVGLKGSDSNMEKSGLIQHKPGEFTTGHRRPVSGGFVFEKHPLPIEREDQRDPDGPDEEKPVDRIHGK